MKSGGVGIATFAGEKNSKNIPTGIKIISILHFIWAGYLVLFSVNFVVAGFMDLSGSWLLSIVLLIVMFLIILAIITGEVLWTGKSWARIVSCFYGLTVILITIYFISRQMGFLNAREFLNSAYIDRGMKVGIVANSILIAITVIINLYLCLNKKIAIYFNLHKNR
jgi:hypothetical protein